ncbi:proline-rich receptor-like protein kinase PERK2 [Mastomys coucha]|uniref:proline-rich receptor-like protein kinase PERK2 n=1 Tax=Mastomys coucha TaxID=35658 RepID=UPI001261C29E|nr:proline-rich receptor-like protein kinase PERK2 [Mastomys coucha]
MEHLAGGGREKLQTDGRKNSPALPVPQGPASPVLTPGAAPVTAAVVVTAVVVAAASQQCRLASERQRAAPARSTPAPPLRAPDGRRSPPCRRAAVALSLGSVALTAFPLAPGRGRGRRLSRGTFFSFMRLTPPSPPPPVHSSIHPLTPAPTPLRSVRATAGDLAF